MYKAQNKEMNLKLVKLVEDKDAHVLKLSEKLDSKLEQMVKAISEISVPKVVEKIVEKVIEKPGATLKKGEIRKDLKRLNQRIPKQQRNHLRNSPNRNNEKKQLSLNE